MVRPWVSEEMESVDLKDKRLNKRLRRRQRRGHP